MKIADNIMSSSKRPSAMFYIAQGLRDLEFNPISPSVATLARRRRDKIWQNRINGASKKSLV